MKTILNHIEKRATEVNNLPFFKLFDQVDAEQGYELLRKFAPSFVHLAMTFRDLNLLYLVAENPDNKYEREINAHAIADSEHWHFLLEDLELLSLNSEKPLTDTIKLLWADQDTYIREYIYSVLTRVAIAKDYKEKFVLMEAAEAGVRVFFDTLKKNAKKIYDSRGIELKYFGDTHIDTEIETELDASVFDELEIPEAEQQKYIELVNAHYKSNRKFLDGKYKVALNHLKKEAV